MHHAVLPAPYLVSCYREHRGLHDELRCGFEPRPTLLMCPDTPTEPYERVLNPRVLEDCLFVSEFRRIDNGAACKYI
jgi:hypothetical protein